MARREIESLGDPNLVPIMAIMCILIPVLLFSFVFYDVKVQDISLPKFGGGGKGGPQVISLSVKVLANKSLEVVEQPSDGSEPTVTVLEKVPYRACKDKETPCSQCDGAERIEYNYAGLYNTLRKLKNREEFKEQDSITIAAEENIPWRVTARVIDAVRNQLEEDEYGVSPDQADNPLCHYERAPKKRDKNIKIEVDPEEAEEAAAAEAAAGEEGAAQKSTLDPPVPLFPKVVFSLL